MPDNVSPASDILNLLEADGLGVVNVDMFDNREPDVLNKTIVTAFDTGASQAPEPKYLRDYPTIQFRVRGTPQGYEAARLKANAVKDALLGRDPVVIGTINYCGFWMVDDIISLGYDGQDRPLLSLNFRLVTEAESGGHRQPL